MSKYITVIAGALEIGVGLFLEFVTFGASTPLTVFLITSGVGTMIGGIGTMLAKGPVSGTSTGSRNPIAPWNVQYGRGKVGGTLVYINSFGDHDKYLDLVFVLASHQCKSVDALMLDGKRVRLDGNGDSFVPTQQTVSITSISRSRDTVTVTLAATVTDLETGDSLQIQNVSPDRSFNGIYPITVIDTTHFSYTCGGVDGTNSGSGEVVTLWPNYKAKIHMEVLLGDHTSTFPGMLLGTPYDGDPGNLFGLGDNPWTADHKLLGRCSAFLRLHYNDEIFKQGLPTIAFRISGKNNIFDPRSSTTDGYQVLNRPTTLLNGWGHNAHVGAYELGVDQGYNFGLNDDTTYPYVNPDNACDTDLKTYASIVLLHTHRYAGCVWQCGSLSASPSPALYLNVLSEVRAYTFTGRSAGVWYSLDSGTTWIEIYNSPAHPLAWDSIELSLGQDPTHVQVMAFTDAHDDMGHFVYDIQLANGPGTSTPDGAGYSENAALCIADYLASPVYGFGAAYDTEIPLDELIAAANICDEAVEIASGAGLSPLGTEPRYTCNGGFPLTLKRGEVLQNMLTSCGGRLTYVGGQYFINPAAWVGPSLTLPLAPHNCFAVGPYGLATGSVGYTISRSLGNNVAAVIWKGFTAPTLPDDAVIQDIRAVLVCSAVKDVAVQYFKFGNGLDLTTVVQGFPFTQPFGTAAGAFDISFASTTLYSDSLGTDLGDLIDATHSAGALSDLTIRVLLNTSLDEPLLGDRGLLTAEIDITAVGVAVYYTSATAGGTDPYMTPPYAVPGGQGLAWSIPLDSEQCGFLVGGLGIFDRSQGFGFASPAAVLDTPPGTTDASAMQLSASALAQAQGPFRWKSFAAIRDLYNGVKGTYIAPENNWQASDFPPYAQDNDHGYASGSPMYPFGDANLAADGGDRRWFDIQLPFTISSPTAQRLAKIELMRRRQQGSGTFSFNLALYTAKVLDVMQVSMPYMGWLNKLLEITASRFVVKTLTQQGEVGEVTLLGTEFDVQEADSSVYDWSSSEELSANGSNSGSLGSGVGTVNSLANTYILNPPFVLSQPSATEIDLQACTCSFGGNAPVSYIARTFTIDAPTGPTWYYVTVSDTEQIGDVSPLSAATCQADDSLAGVLGETYMGAILALPDGGAVQVLPGGWPPPPSFQVGA